MGVFRDGAAPQLALHPSLCRPGCRAPRPEGGGQVLAVALSALLALPLQGVCSYWLIPHGHTPALPATSTPLKTLLSQYPSQTLLGMQSISKGPRPRDKLKTKHLPVPSPLLGRQRALTAEMAHGLTLLWVDARHSELWGHREWEPKDHVPCPRDACFGPKYSD